MANRLQHETSPYLLQHAHNPVDWQPWDAAALAQARAENKPIMLSIGYAACHWCHVMERESFEDPEIARLLNAWFVPIKVDREERPDLDDVYMAAVQIFTRGHGGWPMTVFLTPDGLPFGGGTYFPPRDMRGMPSFGAMLKRMHGAWEQHRPEVLEDATRVAAGLQPDYALSAEPDSPLDTELLARAALRMAAGYDPEHGGFGHMPKFPQPMTLEALLRAHRRTGDARTLEIVTHTLESMARGGIYDQIGGGFARYSTDAEWLVPHFEKMLYDNAQLVRVYTHAWQVTQRPLFARVVRETIEWLLREMTHASGGFYSTLDADSEGHEGKAYLWTMPQIEQVLGHADARLVNLYYGLFDGVNFEGGNILYVPRALDEVARTARVTPEELEAALTRAKPLLLAARAQRVQPARDEKVLTAWNGLMLGALAEAARVFGRADWRAAAERAGTFALARLRTPEGRLYRTWKDTGTPEGQAKLAGYLEDYAFLCEGLLELYQTTFAPEWFSAARALADAVLAHFTDAQWGFYDTADDAEALIVRPKNLQDNAIPSGNSAVALALLKLGAYTGDARYRDAVWPTLTALSGVCVEYPQAFGHWLSAYDFVAGPAHEVAVLGEPGAAETDALLAPLTHAFRPNQVVALSAGPDDAANAIVPLLAGRTRRDGRATVYVCVGFVCQLPVTTPEALAAQLADG